MAPSPELSRHLASMAALQPQPARPGELPAVPWLSSMRGTMAGVCLQQDCPSLHQPFHKSGPSCARAAVPEPHWVMQPQHECSDMQQHRQRPGLAAPLLAQPGGLESAQTTGSKPISEQPQIKCLGSAPSAPAAAILLGAVYRIPSRASSHSPLQRARNCPKFSCSYSFSNNNKQRSREGGKKATCESWI